MQWFEIQNEKLFHGTVNSTWRDEIYLSGQVKMRGLQLEARCGNPTS
jgi:hypothetical protein